MIDWHSHILSGLDDGALEMEHSIAMATALAAAGFTDVYCTPHLFIGRYEAANELVRQGVAELQERLDMLEIPLTLHPGREYCLDEYLLTYLEDPLPLGDSRSVLVELVPRLTIDRIRYLVGEVVKAGFTPVIAHPERCYLLVPPPRRMTGREIIGRLKSLITGANHDTDMFAQSDIMENPLLNHLRELGCVFQGNLGSFTGLYGEHVKAFAEALFRAGIYDRFGSDFHAPDQADVILSAIPLLFPSEGNRASDNTALQSAKTL